MTFIRVFSNSNVRIIDSPMCCVNDAQFAVSELYLNGTPAAPGHGASERSDQLLVIQKMTASDAFRSRCSSSVIIDGPLDRPTAIHHHFTTICSSDSWSPKSDLFCVPLTSAPEGRNADTYCIELTVCLSVCQSVCRLVSGPL